MVSVVASTSPARGELLIVGPGRHGKDYLGYIFSQLSHLRYWGSTSWAALPYIAEMLGVCPQLAWETRHANRTFWRDACRALRRNDVLFLVKETLRNADIVVGIRDAAEMEACSTIFEFIIWVDARGRIPETDPTLDIGPEQCDLVIDNNGSKEALWMKADRLVEELEMPRRADGPGLLELYKRSLI